MTYQDVYQLSDDKVTERLLQLLRENPGIRRKELLEKCVLSLGFTAEQISHQETRADVVRAKSRLGTVLSACLSAGYIEESEIGILQYIGRGPGKVTREQARDFIVSYLKEQLCAKKENIYRAGEVYFGTDKTPDRKDDNDLRSVLGKVIARLEQEGHIFSTAKGYCLAEEGAYPNTELGSWLRRAANGGDLQECFLEAIHTMGGEWFEIYCVELLECYYKHIGKTVLTAAVSGGSADGGIDGTIQTEDWLGYRETILMQMKNRHATMTQKDIREFYGAVCAEKGTRGVFVTVSQFHREAWTLINRVDNLTGIDGEKLFTIACQCQHGIIMDNEQPRIDERFFLDQT